jgi:osmotically-inducible protein OsmY
MNESVEDAVLIDIHSEVANALYWDLAIPAYRVVATVDDGWVTLLGEVERPYQRSCAEADVLRVPGVLGVRNKIAVRPVEQSGERMLDS